MILEELLNETEVIETKGDLSCPIEGLTFDSRQANPQGIFFAVRGTQTDGHRFIDDAIRQGASAIVCETWPEILLENVCYIRVADTSAAMGRIAAAYYGYPSRQLKLIGITGTNGKTTTATLLYELFRRLGYKVGLISTVTYCIDSEQRESTHTTPDSIRLNEMMGEMVGRNKITPSTSGTWMPSLSISMQYRSLRCGLPSARKAANALSVSGSSE